MNGVADGREFLCHDVAPGDVHDFTFQIVAPASTGAYRLGVSMVGDGVEWFGAPHTWNVGVATSSGSEASVLGVSLGPPSLRRCLLLCCM